MVYWDLIRQHIAGTAGSESSEVRQTRKAIRWSLRMAEGSDGAKAGIDGSDTPYGPVPGLSDLEACLG